MTFDRNLQLEEHFTVHGIQWTVIDQSEHARLDAEWNSIYSKVFCGWKYRHGAKAEGELANRRVSHFLFVPFLGARGGPHSIAKRRLTAAYDCTGDLVPLGQFCVIDFFIAPLSLE